MTTESEQNPFCEDRKRDFCVQTVKKYRKIDILVPILAKNMV